MSWVDAEWLLFDTETTGPIPTEAHIVTATLVELDEKRRATVHNWIINPGVPVPDEAAAIHGWTTERVQAEGQPPEGPLAEISGMVLDAWSRGVPVLAYNAPFDLTVTDREMERHLGGALPAQLGPVLDPLVCDKALDRYRKGKRTLTAACDHYQVRLGDAHQSDADALAAGRVMWRLARVFPQLQAMTLTELQPWQATKYAAAAESLEKHFRKVKTKEGRPQEEIDAVHVERSWPLQPRLVKEAAA